MGCSLNAAINQPHTNGMTVFEEDAIDLCITPDRQIRTTAHLLSQVGDACVLTHTIDHIERIRTDPMLFCSVEIIDVLETKSTSRLDKSS
jgi:hypothetical protein